MVALLLLVSFHIQAQLTSLLPTGLYPATGEVVLNDLEPHDWALYTTAVDKPLRTLDPTDVKITYRGYGGNNVSSNTSYTSATESAAGYVSVRPSEFTASSAAADVSVGISQEERKYHTLVYYKTLERVDGKTAGSQATGRVEYRTIFNPFSRRPTYNLNSYNWSQIGQSVAGAPCWRGFYKWRLDRVSGGDIYTSKTGGTAVAVGQMIPADKKLYFQPDGSTAMMEVEFTAMWAPAVVRFYQAEHRPSLAYGQWRHRDSVGVERNFVVCDAAVRLTGPAGGTTKPQLPVEEGGTYNNGNRCCTYTALFPNGTWDGFEAAYETPRNQIASTTPKGVTRNATYLDLCPYVQADNRQWNRVVSVNSDVRFEYIAVSRLRGANNGFCLNGSYAHLWGTLSSNGHANLTLGRGLVPMFDDNIGTFNDIWAFGPGGNTKDRTEIVQEWGYRRSTDNRPLNHDATYGTVGQEILAGNYSRVWIPPVYQSAIGDDTRVIIRLESGYVGRVICYFGWSSRVADRSGGNINRNGSIMRHPTVLHNGTSNLVRFYMGTDYDRADETQKVRNLGTDYAARGYASYDQMLYHEVYKNATVKMYEPYRSSHYNMKADRHHCDSIYLESTIKSGLIGQNAIDDGFNLGVGGSEKSIYQSHTNNNNHVGKRRMLIEGGMFYCSVSLGGWDYGNDRRRWKHTNPASATAQGSTAWSPKDTVCPNDVSTLRMTGGYIAGSLYGGSSSYTFSGGGRQMILTGGTVRAWITGAINGNSMSSNPAMWQEGVHYGSTWLYIGGNFHVGSGDTTHTSVGGTANNGGKWSGITGAKDGHVFGAGSGMRPFDGSASGPTPAWDTNAFKTFRQGRVDSSFVWVADNAVIESDVYGGGNYGYNMATNDNDDRDRGSGALGPQNQGMATLRILGGTIGGRLFGGSNMKMGRMADIRMTGGHVKRGIYGGSNTWGFMIESVRIDLLGGTVGTPEAPATICGGGLGKRTAVFKDITINIGAPGTPGPVIYGNIYGGSQKGTTNGGFYTVVDLGSYDNNYPISDIRFDTSAAQGQGYSSARKTTINMHTGHITGSVFGGGWGQDNAHAATYGDVEVNILGGEVHGDVFGCNDATGKPMGKVQVNLGSPDSVAASIVDGDRTHRNRPLIDGSVYGAGRNAAYGNAPDNEATKVDMYSGTIEGSIFGGGLGATATVSLPAKPVSTRVHVRHGTIRGNVYGGGNAAKVIGNTKVTIGE